MTASKFRVQQIRFWPPGLHPATGHAGGGGLQRSPRPSSWLKGPYFKGEKTRGGEEYRGKQGERKGAGVEGVDREEKGKGTAPQIPGSETPRLYYTPPSLPACVSVLHHCCERYPGSTYEVGYSIG